MSELMRTLPTILCLILFCACGPKPETKKAAPTAPGPAPDTFRVKLDTSKGPVEIEVIKAWAPEGAKRFWELVHLGFYDGARFFRVLPTFVVQFGINGDPSVQKLWVNSYIPDDPVKESNKRGTVTYATRGPSTRTTQIFINVADNERLDASGFAPFGRVVSGMENVAQFYSGYGEGAPRGNGPDQSQIQVEGNAYLERAFPRLDYIKTASIAH